MCRHTELHWVVGEDCLHGGPPFASALRVERLVLNLPLGETGHDPERVDAESDNHQDPPLDPVAEETNARPGEHEPSAFDAGVLADPSLTQHDRVGERNTEGHKRDERCEDCGTDVCSCSAVEVECGYVGSTLS